MKLNPAPTIFDPEQSHLSAESKHLKSPVSDPKNHQQKESKLFKEHESLKTTSF